MQQQQQQQQLVSLFLLLVSTAGVSYGRYLAPRATLIPGQACSFQPYNKLLNCSCGGKVGERHELTLQLQLFIRDQGQEVSFFLKLCSVENSIIFAADIRAGNHNRQK